MAYAQNPSYDFFKTIFYLELYFESNKITYY